ncbi:caspase-14-like isoform X3 [Notamacropus eugenii]|uniref:caspase-14-like isoform X3 n=1 Tax=Notamacropus eugenii TaxID=9315 RepID=UPI003B66B930
MSGTRVALTLCALGGQAGEDRAVAALEAMYQAFGFKNCLRGVVKAKSFQEELAHFRELLDAHRRPISCALVVFIAHSGCQGWLLGPDGREVQEKDLVGELNLCQALWGKAKVFLLLGSPNTDLESNAFLSILTDLCRHSPHWHLLEVLTQPSPIPQEVYDMSGKKVALILCVTQDRFGAEQDLKALKRLFQTLGFKSILKMNPTAQDFRKALVKFRERLDACRTTVSCALIVLMAHGESEGRLLGADGQMVEVEEMVKELSTCQVLQGKAKVFLLQGCRGGNRDPGMRPRPLSWLGRWLQHWLPRSSTIPSHADILWVYANMQDVFSRENFPRNLDPVDILRVYSAAEGYVAYRDENGSDFIQTLVEVIIADPHRDLLELLTEVNRKLCEMDVLGPDCDEIRKMNLEIRSSLRKRLCLKV